MEKPALSVVGQDRCAFLNWKGLFIEAEWDPTVPPPYLQPRRADVMLWTIVVILLILWLLGAFIVPVGGSLIHLLLVIALIVIIWNFVAGRRSV